jgi:hypothetical protein
MLLVYSAHTAHTGLSNQIEINSYFLIKSNVFAQIKSSDFFDFWYHLIFDWTTNRMTYSIIDTIWFLRKCWTIKTFNCNRNKNEKFTKQNLKGGFSGIYAFVMDNSFENWPFSRPPIFVHDCWCSFVLNRIDIKSKLNPIKRFLQLFNRK